MATILIVNKTNRDGVFFQYH